MTSPHTAPSTRQSRTLLHRRKGGRITSGPYRLVPAALVLALAAAGTGCSQFSNEPHRYTQACGVVLDGSGSAAADPKGFDAQAKTEATLTTFLSDRKCRTVSFAPITKVSQSSPCRASRIDLDPDLSDETYRDSTRVTLRSAALSSAGKLLRCAQQHDPGSDVLGGLSRIALAKPSGGKSFDVLVVSDFDQRDTDFRLGSQDLSTAAQRKKVIDAFLSSHSTPRLSGTDLYPVGYGMAYEKASRFPQFDAFWKELLQGRVKAHVHTDYR